MLCFLGWCKTWLLIPAHFELSNSPLCQLIILFGGALSFRPTFIHLGSAVDVFSNKNLSFIRHFLNVDKRPLLYLGDRGRLSPMLMLQSLLWVFVRPPKAILVPSSLSYLLSHPRSIPVINSETRSKGQWLRKMTFVYQGSSQLVSQRFALLKT